ncbi:MAG: GNAT family N-acetyltransferase [Candidatus Pacebacteria bacterium]|nr:GNAT family N-acetyltransferase [Candidatus Paceibacterota bacterium]
MRKEWTIFDLRSSETSPSIKKIAKVLAKAFQDYPFSKYVFPNGKLRKEILPAYFAAFVRYFNLCSGMISIEENFWGAALWFKGPEEGGWLKFYWRIFRCGMLPVFFRAGWGSLIRWVRAMKIDEKAHSVCVDQGLIPSQHNSIGLLAVDPKERGNRLGVALMKYIIEEPESVAIYLETHEEANVTFYKKFGFQVVKISHSPVGKVWSMVRYS